MPGSEHEEEPVASEPDPGVPRGHRADGGEVADGTGVPATDGGQDVSGATSGNGREPTSGRAVSGDADGTAPGAQPAVDGAAGEAREPGSGPPPEPGSAPSHEPESAPATGSAGADAGPSRAKASQPGQRTAHGTDPETGRQKQDELASAVLNFGAVYAPNSTFGTAGEARDGQRRRARTGKLTGEDISTALDHFVCPVSFADAQGALANDRITVLVGAASIGKAASAIALLREVTSGSLAVLSPTIPIGELAEREFKNGFGYVVMDWQHDQARGDASDFTWRTLRDQVCDAGAHLVITTTSERIGDITHSVRQFHWRPPAIRDLLAIYLRGSPAESRIDDIISALPGDCGIRPTVALAQRLAAGDDPEKALEELGHDTAEYVQRWFTAEPALNEILEVIALAFATGRSERTFESMLARLRKKIQDAGYALDDDVRGGKRRRDAPRPLRPVRAERNRADSLLAQQTVVIEGAARTVVDFRVDGYGRQVLVEGWRRYDGTFWNAIRGWLNSVIADSAAENHDETKVRVAAGLATLAGVDMSEVEDSYLEPWASGQLGWAGQVTAAYVLWWMCYDDALAPVALRIASRWATRGDPVRRWTAASTFSGELGVRYPTEATNRLWHLIIQAKDSTDAIFALAQLFATLTAGQQDAVQVLALLDQRLEDISCGRRDLRQQNLIMLSTLTVLSVRDARSGLPFITLFLRDSPDRRAIVGRLWAGVLRYRPLRRGALTALIDAAAAFDNATGQPETDARLLGSALAEALREGEHEPLSNDLVNQQAHRKRKRQDVAGILRALLAALERLNAPDTGDPQ